MYSVDSSRVVLTDSFSPDEHAVSDVEFERVESDGDCAYHVSLVKASGCVVRCATVFTYEELGLGSRVKVDSRACQLLPVNTDGDNPPFEADGSDDEPMARVGSRGVMDGDGTDLQRAVVGVSRGATSMIDVYATADETGDVDVGDSAGGSRGVIREAASSAGRGKTSKKR